MKTQHLLGKNLVGGGKTGEYVVSYSTQVGKKPEPEFTTDHIEVMKSQLLKLGKTNPKSRLCKNSAFGRLPTAGSFEHVKQPYNLFLEKLGIKLRLPSEFNFESTGMESFNIYMERVIKRIRKLVSEGDLKKAGKVSLGNIKYSKSFRMSAFNYVCSGWYYNMALKEAYKYNHKVSKIIRTGDHKLDYRRVYIPKANGKVRPLGVPTIEGRIVLHLLNGFMQEVMKAQVPSNQHAYIPGKGVMTAWREILEKCRQYDYVYEIDLKNFFPSVNVHAVLSLLRDYQAPEELVQGYGKLCESTPSFCGGKELDEFKFEIAEAYQSADGKGQVNQPLADDLNVLNDQIQAKYGNRSALDVIDEIAKNLMQMGSENTPTGYTKEQAYKDARLYYEQICTPLIDNVRSLKSQSDQKPNPYILPGGLPQGVPTSPFLSICVLKEYMSQLLSVFYADDGWFFGNKPFIVKDNPFLGINHKPEACGGVKYNGQGTSNGLKGLGFRLTKDGKLISETRNGVQAKLNGIFTKIYADEEKIKKEIEVLSEINEIELLADRLKPYGEEKLGFDPEEDDPMVLEFLKLEGKFPFKERPGYICEVHEKSYYDFRFIIDPTVIDYAPSAEDPRLIPVSKTRDHFKSLLKLAKSNLFGFIMSCMVIGDGKNDHSYEDNMKAIRNMLGKLHKKSLIGRLPNNTDSSGAVSTLAKVVLSAMETKSQRQTKRDGKFYKESIKRDPNSAPTGEELKELRRRLSSKRYKTKQGNIRRLGKDIFDSLN